MKIVFLVVCLVALIWCPVYADTIYFSDSFADGTLLPFYIIDDPDPCGCTSDNPHVDTTDHRPGASDNYSYHVQPALGDGACCTQGPDLGTLLGSGSTFYWSYWLKYGASNCFDSGAGKGPEVNGTPSGIDCRIVSGPGIFAESWTIPTPPDCVSECGSGYKCKIIPVIENYSAYSKNGDSWGYPQTVGGRYGQNLNFDGTGTPIKESDRYYIERGYWYRYVIEVTVHYSAGRVRLWIKKEGETERLLIDFNNVCTVNGTGGGDGFSVMDIHMDYNDHGGGGATAGWAYFIDDIYVTSTKGEIPDDSGGDTTPPVVTISTSDPSNIISNSLSISGTASDAVGVTSCKYRIGSAPDNSNGTAITGTTSWSGTATGFSEGANTLYVGCTDAAGNWGSDSITVNLNTPPAQVKGVTIKGGLLK